MSDDIVVAILTDQIEGRQQELQRAQIILRDLTEEVLVRTDKLTKLKVEIVELEAALSKYLVA